jgi:hypothetical protein
MKEMLNAEIRAAHYYTMTYYPHSLGKIQTLENLKQHRPSLAMKNKM